MANERKQSKIKSLRAHIIDMMGLYRKNKALKLDVNNSVYCKMFESEIIDTIKRIEKEEAAVLTMTYPLCESGMVHGFMGVKSYLLNFFYENGFCREYDIEEVNKILALYCAKNSYDDDIAVYNIYSVIYLNALFCDYLMKDYGVLTINQKDCELIETLLSPMSDEAREEILFASAKHLTHGSIAYNNKAFLKYLPAINTACKKKNIAKLLVVE